MKKLFLLLFISLLSNSFSDVAIFAGGCFWCVQHDFDQVDGVVSTTAGYTGGTKANPTYKEVSSGNTGHVEAVEVDYDPNRVSYEELLNFYFHNIDPTRDDGQFCDDGNQYRPVIFYSNAKQKTLAEQYRQNLIDSKKFPALRVQILPHRHFTPPKITIRSITKKIPSATNTTASIAAGTSVSKSFGALQTVEPTFSGS